MKTTLIVGRLMLAALSLALSSCSWVMTNTIPKRPPLHPGTPRDDVIAVLGEPRHTTALSPPRPAASLPNVSPTRRTAMASLRDEYFVSGLVQIPGDSYAGEDNIYPAFFIATGGLIEVCAFPIETVDLTFRSLRWRHLWLWYDRSGKLITYDRR
jgi:hypothetical protein